MDSFPALDGPALTGQAIPDGDGLRNYVPDERIWMGTRSMKNLRVMWGKSGRGTQRIRDFSFFLATPVLLGLTPSYVFRKKLMVLYEALWTKRAQSFGPFVLLSAEEFSGPKTRVKGPTYHEGGVQVTQSRPSLSTGGGRQQHRPTYFGSLTCLPTFPS